MVALCPVVSVLDFCHGVCRRGSSAWANHLADYQRPAEHRLPRHKAVSNVCAQRLILFVTIQHKKKGGSTRKRIFPPLPKIQLCAHPRRNEHYPAVARSAEPRGEVHHAGIYFSSHWTETKRRVKTQILRLRLCHTFVGVRFVVVEENINVN